MRIIYLLLAASMLTSCEGGMSAIDPDKVFASLPGPKVPTMQDSLMDSAHEAEKQGDFKQAAQIYQQMLEKHPDKDVMLALADSYRRDGELDKAIAVYDELLKDDKNLGAKEGKGLALMAKGDYDTPGRLFAEIMKEDPKRWKTLNAMGILFSMRNLNTEAQQYFHEALKNSPDNTSVLNNLGLSQALDRQYDTAINTLGKASSLSPGGTLARKRIDLNMALVYAAAGRLDDANAIATNYFTGAQLDNNLGLYAHLAKDNQLAKTYLNMALSESKTYYAKAWDNLQEIDGTDVNNSSGVKTIGKKNAVQDVAKVKTKPAKDTDE